MSPNAIAFNKKVFAAAMLLAGGAGFSHASIADECRKIQSVKDSASSTANNAAGGHLNRHIFGATPPPGYSQIDGTMFTSVDEYTGFWRNYQNPAVYKGTAVNCSGATARQRVSVHSVLKKQHIGAYSCTAADPNGQCTEKTRKQFENVQLDFKVVDGVWILLTAYPTASN